MSLSLESLINSAKKKQAEIKEEARKPIVSKVEDSGPLPVTMEEINEIENREPEIERIPQLFEEKSYPGGLRQFVKDKEVQDVFKHTNGTGNIS